MVLQPLLGPYGKLPILIRDDDTNFFTKPSMLDTFYSEAWKDGFKVSLSVVPYQKTINDISVPPLMRDKDLHFLISDNQALVNYLKQKIHSGQIEILQHGFTHHIGSDGRGEYGKDLDTLDKTQSGRNIIRQALDVNPVFFVPPGEDISQRNLNTLIELGFVPIFRKTYFDKFLRNTLVPSYVKNVSVRAIAKYRNKTSDGRRPIQLVKPVVISVEEHAISWSFAPIKTANISSIESLLKLTDNVIESCGISRNPICLLNHYHLYYHDWNDAITRQDLYYAWQQILKKFKKVKFIWKVTFSEIYGRAKKIHDIHISKTGLKITIESKTPIRNFSFTSNHRLESNPCLVFNEEERIITIEELSPGKKIILYEQ